MRKQITAVVNVQTSYLFLRRVSNIYPDRPSAIDTDLIVRLIEKIPHHLYCVTYALQESGPIRVYDFQGVMMAERVGESFSSCPVCWLPQEWNGHTVTRTVHPPNHCRYCSPEVF